MTNAIVDLSCIFWRNYHATDQEEIGTAARKTLGFVRSLYGRHESVTVAVDSPPYKRREWYPEYKGQRAERTVQSIDELRRCVESILDDGYPVASCSGWEADDVIATLLQTDPDCVVYGTDKDLLSVCNLTDPWTGDVKTAESRLGVTRQMVPTFLSLTGDKSDNIPGIRGVGEKTAVALIDAFGDIYSIMHALEVEPDSFKPRTREAFSEASETLPMAIRLVELNTTLDVVIEQREVTQEDHMDTEIDTLDQAETTKAAEPETKIVRSVEQLPFRHSLEPVGLGEAWRVSKAFEASRMYSQFPNAEAIMVTIMRGRALGLDATTALDSIHVIKGKPTMSATLMVGLVLSSGKCEYFDCVEFGAESVTYATRRKGSPNEVRRTFTIADARAMGLTGKDNWNKQPAVMLQHRCESALCRMVYPDVVAGLYATEEME